jgi:hypothetical protein
MKPLVVERSAEQDLEDILMYGARYLPSVFGGPPFLDEDA